MPRIKFSKLVYFVKNCIDFSENYFISLIGLGEQFFDNMDAVARGEGVGVLQTVRGFMRGLLVLFELTSMIPLSQ